MKRVCVFCGSSMGNRPIYRNEAEILGRMLAESDIGLVYGGAKLGLMGTIADAVLAAGGEVIGVIPKHLLEKEVAHGGLTKLHVVPSMHERKALMAELADGFIALPGGFGTWEEMIEAVTWAQLALHGKPCVLLNTAGYYDPLLQMIEKGFQEGFLGELHRSLVLTATAATDVISLMRSYESPGSPELFAHWQEKI